MFTNRIHLIEFIKLIIRQKSSVCKNRTFSLRIQTIHIKYNLIILYNRSNLNKTFELPQYLFVKVLSIQLILCLITIYRVSSTTLMKVVNHPIENLALKKSRFGFDGNIIPTFSFLFLSISFLFGTHLFFY